MNPVIMLVVAILLLVGAVIRSIEWRKIAVNWVSPDPKNATIFIKSGNIVKPVLAERDRDNLQIYNYKEGKVKKSIVLPANYPEEYLRSSGRRIIGIQDGQAVASPLGFMSSDDLVKYRESPVEISVLVNSHAVIKALRSISETKPFNWMILLVIGAVIVIGLYFFQNYNKAVPGNQPVQSIPAQNITQPGGISPVIIKPPVRVTP